MSTTTNMTMQTTTTITVTSDTIITATVTTTSITVTCKVCFNFYLSTVKYITDIYLDAPLVFMHYKFHHALHGIQLE